MVVLGFGLLAFGGWVCSRGFAMSNWRDDSVRHVVQCVTPILVGGVIGAFGIVLMFSSVYPPPR